MTDDDDGGACALGSLSSLGPLPHSLAANPGAFTALAGIRPGCMELEAGGCGVKSSIAMGYDHTIRARFGLSAQHFILLA